MKKRIVIVGGLVSFAVFAAWLFDKRDPSVTPVLSVQTKLSARFVFVDQEGPNNLGERFEVTVFGIDTLDQYYGRYHHVRDSLDVRSLNRAEEVVP